MLGVNGKCASIYSVVSIAQKVSADTYTINIYWQSLQAGTASASVDYLNMFFKTFNYFSIAVVPCL